MSESHDGDDCERYETGTRKQDIKKNYVLANIIVIALGFMQFGYGIASWSNLAPAFARAKDWDDDEQNKINTIVQSITIFGSMCGALSCSKVMSFGKLRLILALNLLLCIGVVISIVTMNIWVICAGRFIWGAAFGAFSVCVPKFVDEIVPVEHGGSFGAINQLFCCIGQTIPCTMALAYPKDFANVPTDDFYCTTYWRIIWSVPILIALLQVVLLSTCFRNVSPVELIAKNDQEELLVVMKKYYGGVEIQKRIALLSNNGGEDGEPQEGIVATFFDPTIRGAAWVGFSLVCIQQLTGINAVIFFSGQLFDGGSLSSAEVSCMINWTCVIACLGGSVVLGFLGRRQLMLITMVVCSIGIVGMWFFQEIVSSDSLLYVLTIIYIAGFQFGPGPIVWMYLSEICNDQATTINTLVMWFWTLFMSITTLIFYNAIEGWLFLIYGATCTMGTVYCLIFMKETRGVPKDQCKRLYNKNAGEDTTYDKLNEQN